MRKWIVAMGVFALLATATGIYAADETEPAGQTTEVKKIEEQEPAVKGTEAKTEMKTEAAIAEPKELKPGVYVLFDTTMGKMVAKLFDKEAPNTVANFVGLAEGTKEFTDPKAGQRVKRPFYDGLLFHRVIPDFMIQGGCPLGTGKGGTENIKDEINKDLKHDRPGILSMANRGPNTGSCQFFITEKATPWLDGKHAIFGEIVNGLEVAKSIARVPVVSTNPTDPNANRPKTDVVMTKVRIVRVAEGEKVGIEDVLSGKVVKEPAVPKPVVEKPAEVKPVVEKSGEVEAATK
jgi:peptidyl-prolyl cis-trans isomerase A (cyclophilin A)